MGRAQFKCLAVSALTILWIGAGIVSAQQAGLPVAQFPTPEERIEASGLSSRYDLGWRAGYMEVPDAPDGENVVCYRKDFTLSAPVRKAEVSFLFDRMTPYWITVNGNALAEPGPGVMQFGPIRNFDLTGALQEGENVITFAGRCRNAANSNLAVDGIVFCEDGSTMRLLSDGWRGGWNLPDGWDRPGADTAGLAAVPTPEKPVTGRADRVPPRPYYGPMQFEPQRPDGTIMSQPLFNEEEPVLIDVTLMNLQKPGAAEPVMSVEIFDEINREELGRREIRFAPKRETDFGARMRMDPMPRGTYLLRCVLRQEGAEVDRRDYEIASIGVIEQREVQGAHYTDGLDLREVWSVDCTAEPEEGAFIACNQSAGRRDYAEVETEVVDGPAGRYRQLAENEDSHNFAYKYNIERLYAPHLAVVEYPDDAKRNILVTLKEPGIFGGAVDQGYQRSESAVTMDQDLMPERTNRMKKLYLLFWPNNHVGSIHVNTIRGGEKPAAASRITIYEITNDLPALHVADAGERLIGVHTERGPWCLAANYYAGPLAERFLRMGPRDHPEFYRNFYTATENMIKRMRFSGQNLYLMGHFMYRSTVYPSRMADMGYSQNNYGGADWVRDYNGLMLRMFERNGMSMISGVEHFSCDAYTNVQPTPEEIREGVEHPFQVGRDGRLFPIHSTYHSSGYRGGSGRPREDGWCRWPAMNYFHPEVQERFLAIVGEISDLYRDYPAWNGLAIFVSRCMGPMEVSYLRSPTMMWAGYEDFTVDLYEEETGVRIPVAPNDPERFRKRYEWLVADPARRDHWITWRCGKYTALFRRLRDRIQGERGDIKLHIILGEPMLWEASQEMLDGHYDDRAYLLDVLKQFGFDLPKLMKEEDIAISGNFAIAGSGAARNRTSHQGWREMTLNSDWQDLIANNNLGGAYLKSGLQHYGAYNYPEGDWIFTGSGTRQGWFWSTHLTESFVNVMARSNPTWIPHTWTDVCDSMGRLQEHRIFARAYRSLPNGRYERLTGNGLETNIWISQTEKEGATWAYAANLDWWRPTVTLRFTDGTQVRDLIRDEPVAHRDNQWTFLLEPYSIQSFRVTNGRILSAETRIPEEDRAHIVKSVQQALAESRQVLTEAQRRSDELAGKPGWDTLPELESRIERLNAEFESGDLAGAYRFTLGALPIARDVIARVLRGEGPQTTYP